MSEPRLLYSPEFRAAIEEFADAATTMSTNLNSFLLLLNAGVSVDVVIPHLQTAFAAVQRLKDSGATLNELFHHG